MQFTKLAELPDTLPVVSVIHHRRTNCVSDEGRRPASTSNVTRPGRHTVPANGRYAAIADIRRARTNGYYRPEPDIHLACQNEALTNDETPYFACTDCAWRGGRFRRYECAGRLWLRLARLAAGGTVSDVLRDPTEARSDGAGLSQIHDRLPRRPHRMSLPIVAPSARS